MSLEAEYVVYRWEDEAMSFAFRTYVRHGVGEAITDEMVRGQVEADVRFATAGRYRAIPRSAWVDIEVKAEVVLS